MKLFNLKENYLVLLCCGVLWLLLIGAGMGVVLNYENTAGAAGHAPALWPATSSLPRDPKLPTLVMTIHPHCPCSRASIGELARLMSQAEGRVNATVLFIRPAAMPVNWEDTDLRHSAASIPGVKTLTDENGHEAALFGAETSGQTMLYDAYGRLLFSGGITAARGHAGDNDGLSALTSLINTSASEQKETSVFGCPLFDHPRPNVTPEECHAIKQP